LKRTVYPASPLILGIAGHPSSGKDTVSEYLVRRYGFRHVSLGDIVRFYVAEHNLGEPTRSLLHDVSNRLRGEQGADYLACLALQTAEPRLAISGLRTIAESTRIQNACGAILGITATLEHRYCRALERGRIGEDISLERFSELEASETANPDPAAQNVAAVLAAADFHLTNDGSREDLYAQIDAVLAALSPKSAAAQ
jgi:dephospho-CoA kinase